MKKLSLILLIVVLGGLVFLSLPQPTQAGLVPCGLRKNVPDCEENGLCPDRKTPCPASRMCPVSAGGIDESVPCQLCHTFVLFNNVVDFLLFRIVPPLAVLMLVIGGFMYIFAYFGPAQIIPGGGKGGPALLGQAKRLITSVVIGIVIMFGAWAIVNTFFQAIGVEEWTGLKTWWKIKGCPAEITAPPATTATPPTAPSTSTPPTAPSTTSDSTPVPGTSATPSAPTTKTCYCEGNDCYQDGADCRAINIYSSCQAREVLINTPCIETSGSAPPPTTATPPTAATKTCYCYGERCYTTHFKCQSWGNTVQATCLTKQVPINAYCSPSYKPWY